jgi:DNA-binding NarL/FixJ family response regulator
MMPTKLSKPKSVTPVKVVIVDDHPAVRKVLALCVSRNPALTLSAAVGTVALALKAFEAHEPGLVILDIELPDGSGIDLIRTLRQAHAKTRILVFSMQPQDTYLPLAMEAGAHAYIHKSEPPQKVFDAIGQGMGKPRGSLRLRQPRKKK